MGEKTKIGWCSIPNYTGATWNPWQGCHKLSPKSPACANCYMFREKGRYGQEPDVVVRSTPHTFNMPLRVKEPHAWFTLSWSDFLIEEADPWRDEAWDIIRRTPQHLYLILTKRIDRWQAPQGWPYKNVWMGVTAENQPMFDLRVPKLLEIDTPVHWVSCEPLLGGIDIARYAKNIQWVIAGGESGPDARIMNVSDALSLKFQCEDAHIPFYLKQHGEWASGTHIPISIMSKITSYPAHFDENSGVIYYRVGVKNAGDMLYGKQYHEFPKVEA